MKKIGILALVIFACSIFAWGASQYITQVIIGNSSINTTTITDSSIDSTPIGASTPSTIAATSIGASSLNVTSETAGTINVTSGLNTTSLTLNSAAPSGHTLCGNGTSYVDASSCGSSSTYTQSNCLTGGCVGGTYAAGSTYTNTTSHPLIEMVNIQGTDSSGGCTGPSGLLTGYLGGTPSLFTEINNDCNTDNISGFTLIVPPGVTFAVNITMIGSGSYGYVLNSWYEIKET